jgi:hypothetical protein
MEPDTQTAEGNSQVQTDATDAEVTEAVEALVRSVEAEGQEDSASVPAKRPATKSTRKPTSKPKSARSTEPVDSLVETVHTLAESVATLASTVEVLSDKANGKESRRVKRRRDRRKGESEDITAAVRQSIAPLESASVQSVEVTPAESAADETVGNPLLNAGLGYVGIIGTFLGAGLVATAMMRAPFGLSAIAMLIAGCAIFVATAYLKRREAPTIGLALPIDLATALVTVLGLGMLVGGIQNFGESPERAAKLIPVGVVLVAAAYLKRSKVKLSREHFIWVASAGVWVCLILAIGLGTVASSGESSDEGGAESPTEEGVGVGTEHGTTATSTVDTHATGEHEETTAAATSGHAVTTTLPASSESHKTPAKTTATTAATTHDATTSGETSSHH